MKYHTNRIQRELRTLDVMIRIYCRSLHKTKGDLCADCRVLAEYARQRLKKCPYRENKPTCAKCHIHCYQEQMRRRIREVMRYSGPRMLFRHPVLAVLHLIRG